MKSDNTMKKDIKCSNLNISGELSSIKSNKVSQYLFGNKVVLRDSQYLYWTSKNRVNIDAWVCGDRNVNNIGDLLSIVIVDYLLKENNIDINCQTNKTRHLYAIGSILLGFQDSVIWGSGFGRDISKDKFLKLYKAIHRTRHRVDIRALRGPETLRIIKEMIPSHKLSNTRFGDPACLLPLYYKKAPKGTKEFIVVPHYSQYEKYCKKYDAIGTFTSDWKDFVEKILEAKLVISSSLHGIIIAEVYGIPAVMLRDSSSGDITKFKDWYYTTERYNFPIAHTVEEAKKIKPLLLDNKVLEKMQKDLIASFPADLWRQ